MPPRRDVIRAAVVVCLLVAGLATGGYALAFSIPPAKTRPAVAHAAGQAGGAGTTSPAGGSQGRSGASPSYQRPRSTGRTAGPYGSVISTGSAAVALTFDDGPDPTFTPRMLDLLKKHGVKATFCVIGSRARDYPDLIRRIAAEGHTLCNHSWQHLIDLGQRTRSYQSWDLRSTNDAIHAAVPDAPIRYFRAPGGNFTPGLVELATTLGMTPLSWDVDPRDWDAATYGRGEPMVDHVVSVVERTVRAGSVVLSHDRARPDTLTAYRTLLPWLKDRYQLVPLR